MKKTKKRPNRTFDLYSEKHIIITCNIGENLVALIDKLVKAGFYFSRSEFMRNSVYDKILSEIDNYERFVNPIIKADDPTMIRVPNGDGTITKYTRIRVLE